MSEKEIRLGFAGNEKTVKVDVAAGMPVPWGLADDLSVMGKDHPRIDALAKVTGRAKYSYDVRFDDLIYAKMLRSPHASATIRKVDLSKAKALKGVLFTEAYEGRAVRYAGAPVAGIAAVSEEVLDDAMALVKVDYDVKPHVVSTDAALKPGAPTVTRRANAIVGRRGRQGNQRAARQAHKDADVVVEAEYRTQVQTHSCLETHGGVCAWDGGKLTVWHSTQSTFGTRRSIARGLGIAQSEVTVITQHMGGGFGSKFGADGWDVFCARAAKATKRPCRYMLDRKEEHMIGGNRPDSIQKCKFSAKKDGTLMGGEVHSWGSGGNGHGGAGVYNPGIYNFRGRYSEQAGVSTHAGGGRAFRAPRHPQGLFALDCMIDELAEKIGMDPLAFRKKNDSHPVRQAEYDIGAKEIGWQRRKKSGSQKGRLRRGLGMAASRWPHTGRPVGVVINCRIGKDGSVLLANGAQDIGTGTRTVIAVIGAEELGLKPSEVTVRLGNTNDPIGPGSGGSTTTPTMAPAIREAAFKAKRELLEAVAGKLGGDAEKMDLKDGQVTGAGRALSFKNACGLMAGDAIDVSGGGRHLWTVPRFSREVAGVQFAEVEVDTETGAVRVIKVVTVQDCGRVVNALTTRSQMNGGVIQGISYALFEDRLLDPNLGDMVNADFLGYKISGALEMPEIVAIPFDSSQGGSITGVSSLGEPCTVPTAGAIGNAVANAIGVHVRSIPITPDKVLKALGAI